MSAEQGSSKKKYKLWKNDREIPIPLSTLHRWKKNSLSDYQTSGTVDSGGNTIEDDEFSTEDDHIDVIENNSTIDDKDSLDSSCSSKSGTNSDMEANDNDLDFDTSEDLDFDTNEDLDFDTDNEDEHSNSDSHEVLNHHNNEDVLDCFLYNGSTMTVDEGVLILLEIHIKNKLTKDALENILKMLQRMLPQDNQMPQTLYKLFQYSRTLAQLPHSIKHYYCKVCLSYIGVNGNNQNCLACNAHKKNLSFFFEIDICDQIKFMFETRDLWKRLNPSPLASDESVIKDITDGSEYRRVNLRRDRGRYDLTLILNTDGISLVKSSKSHCWPLMFTIAELPESIRDLFIATIGLWYDKDCKPVMNTFLKPFCAKLKNCFENGVSWIHPQTKEIIQSKIVAPLIVADAPARAQLQNILNFNGRYGCNICEIRTQRSQRVEGKKSHRIYPFKSNSRLRDGKRMEYQGKKVLNLKKTHIRGVKGKSIISSLPLLDLGTCVLPEYMHSVLLGVVKQFLIIWLTKKGPWNIKKVLTEIDNFMLNIRPPQSFNRMPRRISDYIYYKASEFLNWLLFYSVPALKNYLPDEYFQHWLLLVLSMYNLLQESIVIESDLNESEQLIELFVKKFEELYGDREMTYNVHQLLHLAVSVRRWGPLSGTSAFPFENYNGFLANCLHGTKHLSQELIHNLQIAQSVQVLKTRVTERHDIDQSLRAKKFELLGKCKNILLSAAESRLLSSRNIDVTCLNIYARSKINKEIYTSQIYKDTKTNSFTVQIKFGNCSKYGVIRFFIEIENDPYCLIRFFTVEHCRIFYQREKSKKIKHIIPIKESDRLLLIKLEDIESICHLVRVGDYVCKQPHNLKRIL